MAKNFGTIAFTDAVKSLQEKAGSRSAYARMVKETFQDGLTGYEIEFIEQLDSFYIATTGANGFPYIQHRGGPKGFLKVLDAKRLGFIDFKGNMQYISSGHIATNPNVAMIMVDYPSRTRLKIYAKAEIISLNDQPELLALLDPGTYSFRPDQMMILHVEAYDWNCQQHITPRFTIGEIEEAFNPQKELITKLEAEILSLKAKIKKMAS
jgi:predicted pyridoxine 5'-phosphate oxidase superfamily flavin-nucleotide-binding protein